MHRFLTHQWLTTITKCLVCFFMPLIIRINKRFKLQIFSLDKCNNSLNVKPKITVARTMEVKREKAETK